MSQLLHINDNNLLVQSGSQVSRNQGYAWLKGDSVVFDSNLEQSPVKHCRLAPQEINSHYWQVCAETAISNNTAGMRHAADLVWKHLSDLREQRGLQSLVLVVPSHYRESNLQLLLGIANSSGLNVKGLTNKAVLALHDRVAQPGNYLHVDVQLHQTVVSVVKCDKGNVSLGAIEVLQDVGIHAMQEAILKGLQKNFIQGDRFDPLHDAGTEQQLFNQIPDIARQINETGKATVGVQHQSRLHSASIESKDWGALLEPFVKKILVAGAASKASHVFVDLNAAFDGQAPKSLQGPGLTILSGLNKVAIELLTPENDDSSLVYVTELPAMGKAVDQKNARGETESPTNSKDIAAASAAVSPINKNSSKGATHLMLAGRAVSIDSANVITSGDAIDVQKGASNVQQLLAGGQLTILNDESRSELQANDRLASPLVDGVITVIQVI